MDGDYSYRGATLFVDPGIKGTGWAFFQSIAPSTGPEAYGVLHGKGEEWVSRCHSLSQSFKRLLETFNPKQTVIEFPGLWLSGVSMASASSGDLFKLAYLVGNFGELVTRIPRNTQVPLPVLIAPQKWKGQLPKEVVIRRILAIWPHLKDIKNHEADAVGMGLAAQGGL
jgi:hypothetical protein